MSGSHLPDEIVSKILTPALKFSDKVFSDPSIKQLLAPGYSSSSYLLVCKAWFRVATPLLYSVIILRTTSQAEALRAILEAHQEIGCFIKKVRVEGAFGDAMEAILRSAPNITDVFLSLNLWPRDDVRGLCRGLSLINPRRVILVDDRDDPKANSSTNQLVTTLERCIPKWNKLKSFYFPYFDDGFFIHTVSGKRAHALCAALTKSRSLENLLVDAGPGFPDHLRKMIKIPSFKFFHCRLSNGHRRSMLHSIKNDSVLRARVKCYPPYVFDSIRFLRFISLFNDLWRLASPRANTGGATRTGAHALVHVRGTTEFRRVAKSSGPTTQALSVVLSSDLPRSIDPKILQPFTSLKSLSWTVQGYRFSTPSAGFSALNTLEVLDVHTETHPALFRLDLDLPLPSLRELRLRHGVDASSAIPFIQKHADKLLRVTAPIELHAAAKMFELCTNMETLTVLAPVGSLTFLQDYDNFIACSVPHTSLRKLRFECTKMGTYRQMFQNIALESFPLVKEIQGLDVKWPKAEREIPKNHPWISALEILRAKGIKLTDNNGSGGRAL